jgi:hypothetical protein
VHIYLWILKDYAWVVDSTPLALAFGCSALAWCGVLEVVAYRAGDYEEMLLLVSLSLSLSLSVCLSLSLSKSV